MASRATKHRANGDADGGGLTTTMPVLVSQAPESTSNAAPPDIGLFGSSSLGNSFSKLAIRSTTPSATSNGSLFNNPATGTGTGKTTGSASSSAKTSMIFATNAATPSPTPGDNKPRSGGIFGFDAAPSPAFGSTATQPKGKPNPFATAFTSSGSASGTFFGGSLGGHAGASSSVNNKTNASSGNPFAHLAPTPSNGGTNCAQLKQNVKNVPASINAKWEAHEEPARKHPETGFVSVLGERLDHICASKIFFQFSPEEIRLSDYSTASLVLKSAG
ncbi:hypothetical protein N8I77_013360 [Diaporthe amygdali]|uniref:Uncharacterized protein n=1 Tax=Phomopsis amygdali TaxID=1214568 RepID=A0AAD9S2N3_PHOAM|nr:hypothetical protein N8I77_013360 [Diaporthe amygdali]